MLLHGPLPPLVFKSKARSKPSAKGQGLSATRLILFKHYLNLSRYSLLRCSTHFMTVSARDSTFGGMVRPICMAVFRLVTRSNFIGSRRKLSVIPGDERKTLCAVIVCQTLIRQGNEYAKSYWAMNFQRMCCNHTRISLGRGQPNRQLND